MLRKILLWAALLLAVPAALASATTRRGRGIPTGNRAAEAIRSKEWVVAIEHFRSVVRNEPDNADAHNWLAYAYRNGGNLPLAFEHYRIALKLDPSHRGAHEYIGEAYLAAGDKARAREHLAILERLCGRTCEEYRDLARAIAAAPRCTRRPRCAAVRRALSTLDVDAGVRSRGVRLGKQRPSRASAARPRLPEPPESTMRWQDMRRSQNVEDRRGMGAARRRLRRRHAHGPGRPGHRADRELPVRHQSDGHAGRGGARCPRRARAGLRSADRARPVARRSRPEPADAAGEMMRPCWATPRTSGRRCSRPSAGAAPTRRRSS